MCTIMCAEQKGVTIDTFGKCFKRTHSRGPDMESIQAVDDVIIGFQRLSIMGPDPRGMQPFRLDSNFVVCNGEIYGFRKTKEDLGKKGYEFISESDCEILLPMYKEYGTDMFGMLDAEFALIIYDGEKKSFVAARDPIGIRPLFYGKTNEGGMLFASEAKNLIGLTDKVFPFPPGHYYSDGEFVCYLDLSARREYVKDDLEKVCHTIHDKLIAGVAKRLDSDMPVGYLLSGGLDSSLICSIANKFSDGPIRTFAIGMNEDAIDLKYAKEVADYLGSDHSEIIIDKKKVLDALEEVISMLGTYDITTIRASVGMYLLCKGIREITDIKVLLSGEISDEIFGYKYTDFAPDAEEFQKEAEKRLRELYMYDVLRADRCISSNSMEARVPFGDIDFVKYVMSIPPEMKMNTYNKGKYLLRHAFETGYLPKEILYREKAAFSDAVGHSMVDYIKEYAEGIFADDEFEQLSKQYTHARPFTKESLLYRQIFEKYYPGQSEMVTDFWMPNKNWENCDVQDPSARVLKNYGASGE